jgi:hypothetical protein
MRLVVVLLVVANLVLFAYARLDRAGQSEGARLSMQVEPARIKPMTPQEVAALAPAKAGVAAPAAPPTASVCAEWGPFADADRVRAESDLAPLALGRLVSAKPVATEGATYWVNLGAMPTRAAADARAGELKAQAISDLSVVDYPRGQFTVSLGVFRSEASANARAETLTARGVVGTRVEPRPGAGAHTLLVVRDARENVIARLRELQGQYPGTEIRVAPCPAAS